MPVYAVAFDMDGVLTNSMPSHFEAYRRVFAEKSVTISEHEIYAREGQSSPQVVRWLARERRLALHESDLDAMAKRKQEIFFSFGPQPLYPGAAQLVADLAARGVPLALVTGTYRANAEQHLGPLIKHFRAVISSEAVKKTKPDPEPYRKAFEALGVDPEDGVVIENAVLGVESGKAAGAKVVAITTTLPARELGKADMILSNLAEVREWLRREGVLR